MMKSFLLFCLLVSQNVFATQKIEFKKVQAKLGGHGLVLELARTDEERQMGLMFRESMGENFGMLFVFEDSAIRGFWMKNTYLPLSIGFFDEKIVDKKKVIELVDMQDMEPVPKSNSILNRQPPAYQSRKPAKYALEVNRGWFKRHGIKIGQRLEVDLPK